MELQDFTGAERAAASRAVDRVRRLSVEAQTRSAPDFWRMADRLASQLRARGMVIQGNLALLKALRALLRDLAGWPRGPVSEGLPRVDRELATTLLEIAAWMRRLERPAWQTEVVHCTICGRRSRVPRLKVMEWRAMHLELHRDRVAGILVGLAAGDEIGGPTEMALRLARSLLIKRCYDASDVFGRYLDWHRAGSFDTGPVAARVFDLVTSGMPHRAAARQVHDELDGMTGGCNPAHRAGILAMAPWVPAADLVEAGRREAGLTHHHPVAGETAAAMALLCRHRIMGPGRIAAAPVRQFAGELVPEVRAIVTERRGGAGRSASVGPEATRGLSPGGYSPDALRAALHFTATAGDPVTALADSKRFAGPANYCPVLVGALLGARFGVSAFDDTQLRQHSARKIAEVRAVAGELADHWNLAVGRTDEAKRDNTQ